MRVRNLCDFLKSGLSTNLCDFSNTYRMAPNFQGAQFLWNGLPKVFAEIIFADGEPSDLLQC